MSGSSNRLPVLAGEISAAHSACRKAGREFVQHAVDAGRRLMEAKGMVAHGEWQEWLRQNVPDLSERTARRYMRAAASAGKSATVSVFALRHLVGPTRRVAPKPVNVDKYIAAQRPRTPGEFDLLLGSIVFRRDLYPRSVVYPDLIKRYAEVLYSLPPIEVNQRNELIDGWHRLEAHRQAGAETIRVVITEVKNDDEHLELAIMRNSKHGLQTSPRDRLNAEQRLRAMTK